jgi:hypothetical protein
MPLLRTLFAALPMLGVVAFAVPTPASATGCLSGAVVGGVAGHYAGHHAVVGAIGGCIVGHHMAVEKKRQAQAAAAAKAQVAQPSSSGTPISAPGSSSPNTY